MTIIFEILSFEISTCICSSIIKYILKKYKPNNIDHILNLINKKLINIKRNKNKNNDKCVQMYKKKVKI